MKQKVKIFLFLIIISISIVILFHYSWKEGFDKNGTFNKKSRNNQLFLIHIGKCGGSTVEVELKNHGINFEALHIIKPNYKPGNKYVIIIRNPIQRFISAFNWRYKMVVDDNTDDKPFEREILLKYKTVSELAERIDEYDINNENIGHINADINYYLEDFLSNCLTEDIIGVITTETLDQDMKDIFGITVSSKKKENTGYSRELSEKGYDNVKNYLKKDYECIDKLNEMGLLTEEKYAILSQ